MSGEVNGNLFVIKKGATPELVAGQGEFTLNIEGEPIPITNKSSGNWRINLVGSTTTKAVNFSGTMTFNDDATQKAVLDDAASATEDDYTIELGSTGIKWEGKFVPRVSAYSSPLNNAVEVSIDFLSNGTITRTSP